MFEDGEAAMAHPVGAALVAVDTALQAATDAALWGIADDALHALVAAHEALTARFAALGLTVVHEAERRGVGTAQGASSEADWLRDRLRLTHGEAKGRLDLARRLDITADVLDAARRVIDRADADVAAGTHRTGYPAAGSETAGAGTEHADRSAGSPAGPPSAGLSPLGVDAAALEQLTGSARQHLPCAAWLLRSGRASVDHVQVIRRAMRRLPSTLDDSTWAECEAFLSIQATRHDPRSLARLGTHLAAVIRHADDARDDADAERADQRAQNSTSFGLIDNGDGTVRAYGTFSDADADVITTALAPLAAPKPAEDGTPDPRDHTKRSGEALVELCRRVLDVGDLLPGSRGARPHITITADLSTLRKEAGAPAAVTMWGTPITADELRRIACDAEISRVIVDPLGVPLDVGRAHRTVTRAQWIALTVRDRGCAFPGCSRHAAWCDAHHITHWADGGDTSLDNTVLLCGYHHRSIHHRGWTVQLGSNGHPEFVPPRWIDPAGQPRRNTYHRLTDTLTRASAASDPPGPPQGVHRTSQAGRTEGTRSYGGTGGAHPAGRAHGAAGADQTDDVDRTGRAGDAGGADRVEPWAAPKKSAKQPRAA